MEQPVVRRTSQARRIIASLGRLFKSPYSKAGGVIILAVLCLAAIGPFLTPYAPNQTSGSANTPPSYHHPFGTDWLGHDLFSQVVYGARPSLFVALTSSLGATLLGFFAGVLAGYYKKMEAIAGGSTDVVMAFPQLPLLIIIGSIFIATNTTIAAILIVVLWPPLARALRPQVAALKKRGYVDAAKTTGLNDLRIVSKIIIPEVLPIGMAYFVINVALSLILVTGLQFLGVGNLGVVSWGSILYWAQQYGFFNGDWWWILFPGLVISLTTTAFALIGFSVEEISNPRLRE
jgi:peptide/nickel transport system permease protein